MILKQTQFHDVFVIVFDGVLIQFMVRVTFSRFPNKSDIKIHRHVTFGNDSYMPLTQIMIKLSMFKALHWLHYNIALRNHDSPWFIAKVALLVLCHLTL
jgi:hypothetical protein